MSQAQAGATCPRCGALRGERHFCATCGVLNRYPDSGAYAASRLRRLAGVILDIVVLSVTLGVVWLIWLAVVAPRSQTPGKQMLGMYILRTDGRPASAGHVWVRELLVKAVIFGLAGLVTSYAVTLLDALWILWDRDRQTLHDKLADTIVVHPPAADVEALLAPSPPATGTRDRAAYRSGASREARLRELQELMDRGLITLREYEERRRRILEGS